MTSPDDTPDGRRGRQGAPLPSRGGRKRDQSRDAVILDATIAVLSEVGYEGLTMDAVAARAKAGKATMYRRWASKNDLVRDVVKHIRDDTVDLAQLPDTGTLRGDLHDLAHGGPGATTERKLAVVASLISLLSHDGELADLAGAAIVDPWTTALHALMTRARARDEIPAAADIDALSRVIPSMAAYRTLIERQPVDEAFLLTAIDGVLLPALRGAALPG